MKYLGFKNSTTNHVECWWQCGNSVRCYVSIFIRILLWQSTNCQPVQQKPQSKTSHSSNVSKRFARINGTPFSISRTIDRRICFVFSLPIQLYTDLERFYIHCTVYIIIRSYGSHISGAFCFCFTFDPWNSYHSFSKVLLGVCAFFSSWYFYFVIVIFEFMMWIKLSPQCWPHRSLNLVSSCALFWNLMCFFFLTRKQHLFISFDSVVVAVSVAVAVVCCAITTTFFPPFRWNLERAYGEK